MPEGYFTPWRNAPDRACRTCAASIGTPDGWHLWCARHRIVVVFPCGLWEREPGADESEKELPTLALRPLEAQWFDDGGPDVNFRSPARRPWLKIAVGKYSGFRYARRERRWTPLTGVACRWT